MIHTNKFSLERAKKGEPFTYKGREAKFGSISPDGKSFSIWCLDPLEWRTFEFDAQSEYSTLSMTSKKLEVKIWRNRVTGVHDATTEDITDHVTRTADPKWELLKTKSEEI